MYNEVGNPDGPDYDETEGCSGVEDFESNDPHDTSFHCSDVDSLTKVLHFAIGKPMAHHGKFAVKRTAKATLANYSKLSRAKHRSKKRSPASHKRMANNGSFTFPSVKASHGLPRFLAC